MVGKIFKPVPMVVPMGPAIQELNQLLPLPMLLMLVSGETKPAVVANLKPAVTLPVLGKP